MLENVEWGEYKLGDLFEIQNTFSFNKDSLTKGTKYDYVTRTSQNQGILQKTGFVNQENINPSGSWSLGLLQMDFFYRENPWYAGQFVRKIIPKIELNKNKILFFTVLLNKQKKSLLSGLVRDVDKIFLNSIIQLPIKNKKIDSSFIETFITELEKEQIFQLDVHLKASGLKDYALTDQEQKVLDDFEKDKIIFGEFVFKNIFNQIVQGRRLTKNDQILGNIPFVMAGRGNTGISNYISNPIASFPKNSITIDILGNTFYRDYSFGAGDDTGVYWNDNIDYSRKEMLFISTSMEKSLFGQFDFGKKLRSSQSLNFKMKLPMQDKEPDYKTMEILISAIQKQVIRDVVLYTENKLTI